MSGDSVKVDEVPILEPDLNEGSEKLESTTPPNPEQLLETGSVTETAEAETDLQADATTTPVDLSVEELLKQEEEELIELFQRFYSDPSRTRGHDEIISLSLSLYLNWVDYGQPPDAAKSIVAELFSTANKFDLQAKEQELSPLQQAIIKGFNKYDFMYVDGYITQPDIELTVEQANILRYKIDDEGDSVDPDQIEEFNLACQQCFAATFKEILADEKTFIKQQQEQSAEYHSLLLHMQHIRDACMRLIKAPSGSEIHEVYESELDDALNDFFAIANAGTIIGDDDEKAHAWVYEPLVGAQCEVLATFEPECALFVNEFPEDQRNFVHKWLALVDFRSPLSQIRKDIFENFKTRMHNPTTKIAADELWATLKDQGQAYVAECKRRAETYAKPAPDSLTDQVPQGVLFAQQLAASTDRRKEVSSPEDTALLKRKSRGRSPSTLSNNSG